MVCSVLNTFQASQGKLVQYSEHSSLFKNKEASNVAHEISTSSLCFESRKLWTQHMIALGKQMVSWLTTQFTGCHSWLWEKLYSNTWKEHRKKEQVGKESFLCINNLVTAFEVLKIVLFGALLACIYTAHCLPDWLCVCVFSSSFSYSVSFTLTSWLCKRNWPS